ncbi:MAG: hypothetical protein M2R45_00395 [Verrucomicrobia subdivision 3 bacterium]|nr:hypothetical protein [Limisphaerales bacterium]MCS1412846.1 hypothetical protein [Limisphaerales bacterium]
MLNPLKHLAVVSWFGALMLMEGSILLMHGLRLAPPFPFYISTAACLASGTGILWF